jgi:hypothetical protein
MNDTATLAHSIEHDNTDRKAQRTRRTPAHQPPATNVMATYS